MRFPEICQITDRMGHFETEAAILLGLPMHRDECAKIDFGDANRAAELVFRQETSVNPSAHRLARDR